MPDGPYVQVAAICETAETGAHLSLSNFVDQITVQSVGGQPVPLIQFTLAICLWAGDIRPGPHKLRVRQNAPDRSLAAEATVDFEFPDMGDRPSGVNLISNPPFTVDRSGYYWFDVLFVEPDAEDRLISRIPLEVIWTVQSVELGPRPDGSPGGTSGGGGSN